jgi:hypothetical protein
MTERSKTKRGSEGPGLALLAGAHTVFLVEREDLGTSLLLCPDKMFRQENKNVISLVMVYSALLNCVFEALNLLLILFYYYVAEIQLPGNGLRLFSITQSFG